MFAFLKSMLSANCPLCRHPLQVEHTRLCSIKSCPKGHYTEETYSHLGVSVVYDGME
ncbi:hypothetical protein G3578_08865 [Brevibacillus sp. SYP-B805]|uniref:hypothetical protein n=1 Tax=Brevibacillus sp. SYP-B805 TaxID=1578199 RepID=UPI0013EC3BCE|nr:hypothetical protein [Brevibacillus sp. SYP-B805]NGQ95279.1 hypothetical protein [Brevibacillus sp. SYP-B805]